LSIATSDATVVRRGREKPFREGSMILMRNLGVDDRAGGKGRDYGTMLVNLD